MQRTWRERTSWRSSRLFAFLLCLLIIFVWGTMFFQTMTSVPPNVSVPVWVNELSLAPRQDTTTREEEVVPQPESRPFEVRAQIAAAPTVPVDDTAYATLREWMLANPTTRFTNASTTCIKKLYTPTYLTQLFGEMYVAVDCWHHRVLVHYRLDAPIEEWVDLISASGGNSPLGINAPSTQMKSFRIPHSVATNGEIVVTESSVGGSNGQDHSVVVLRRRRRDSKTPVFPLEWIQEVAACDNNRARRPHRVIYDSTTTAFYLYLTSPAFLSKFVWNREKQQLERVFCQTLPFMKGMYARSIVTRNDSLFMTAGPGVVWESRMDSDRIVPIRSYSIRPLGFMKGKMNDLAWIDGWWYATSTVPCAMVRFRQLNDMRNHEKLHPLLGLCGSFSRKKERCATGTPYFVSKVHDRIMVPYIFGCSGVVSFVVDKATERIQDVVQHWGEGWVEGSDDLTCRTEEW